MSIRKLFVTLFLLTLGLVGLYLFKQKKVHPQIKKEVERIYTSEAVTESDSGLIDDFPNIPVYPGLAHDKSYKKEQMGKTDFIGIWIYKGNIREIMDWYVSQLKKSGWNVGDVTIHTGENELQIEAENTQYKIRIYNLIEKNENNGEYEYSLIADIVEK